MTKMYQGMGGEAAPGGTYGMHGMGGGGVPDGVPSEGP